MTSYPCIIALRRITTTGLRTSKVRSLPRGCEGPCYTQSSPPNLNHDKPGSHCGGRWRYVLPLTKSIGTHERIGAPEKRLQSHCPRTRPAQRLGLAKLCLSLGCALPLADHRVPIGARLQALMRQSAVVMLLPTGHSKSSQSNCLKTYWHSCRFPATTTRRTIPSSIGSVTCVAAYVSGAHV